MTKPMRLAEVALPALLQMPADRPHEQVRGGPADDEPENSDGDRIGAGGDCGLEVLPRLARGREIEVAGEDEKSAPQGGIPGCRQRGFQALEPSDMALHLDPLIMDDRVGIVLESGDGFGGRQGTLGRVVVEDADYAREFVDRAGEPLTILLRELGRLRCDKSTQEADSERNSPQEHRLGPLAFRPDSPWFIPISQSG